MCKYIRKLIFNNVTLYEDQMNSTVFAIYVCVYVYICDTCVCIYICGIIKNHIIFLSFSMHISLDPNCKSRMIIQRNTDCMSSSYV